MDESSILATFHALSLAEWLALVIAMLFGMGVHVGKKWDEERKTEDGFSIAQHFSSHIGAVVSSLGMQFGALYWLVANHQGSIETAFLVGISMESVAGWMRAKSTFKA